MKTWLRSKVLKGLASPRSWQLHIQSISCPEVCILFQTSVVCVYVIWILFCLLYHWGGFDKAFHPNNLPDPFVCYAFGACAIVAASCTTLVVRSSSAPLTLPIFHSLSLHYSELHLLDGKRGEKWKIHHFPPLEIFCFQETLFFCQMPTTLLCFQADQRKTRKKRCFLNTAAAWNEEGDNIMDLNENNANKHNR